MLKFRLLVVLLLIYSCSNIGISQVDTFYCPTDMEEIEPVGELLGTTYTLKVLLIEFSDVRAHPCIHYK